MKKLLFIIILLSFYSFAQENRIVRQQELSDSLDAVRTLIGTGGVPLPDSVIYTSELAPYVDKTTSQTITGQKNFSGTVKFGSDTSTIMEETYNSLRTGLTVRGIASDPYNQFNILRAIPLDPYTADWKILSYSVDFIPEIDGQDHTFTIVSNRDGDIDMPEFGMSLENNYEFSDTGKASEWFLYYQNRPVPNNTYYIRPIMLGVEEYESGRHNANMTFSLNRLFIGGTSSLDDRFDFQPMYTGYAGKLGAFFFNDSSWMKQNINNFGWLYQASNDNGSIEMMRVDELNNVVLAPDPFRISRIYLKRPIYGSITWDDLDSTGTIPIYREESTNKLFIGGNDGMVTNKIKVINIPQDTAGLEQSEFYIDPLTSSVHYARPINLVSNGTFTTWSGSGKSATPTGWTFAPDPRDTTTVYIEQNPTGELHFVWDGSDRTSYVLQSTSSIGESYGYSFEVTAITDTAVVYIVGSPIFVTTTGIHSGSAISVANEKYKILPSYGAGSITLDNMKLWEIGGGIDAPTYDVPVVLDSLGVLISGVGSTSTGNPDSLGGQPASAYLLKSDSTIYLTPSDANSAYATKSHTHTEFFDTLSISFGVMDTVTAGDYVGRKIENNITITEISAYTNTGTVTFNIEERGETTPNTAGTDVMTSDLVADDNQQETTTFSNSGIARDSWLVLNVTSKTGDPTIFGVTIRYVKAN